MVLSDLGRSFASGEKKIRTQVMGYWAPEMRHPDVAVGTPVDIYAAGTVMMKALLCHIDLLDSLQTIAGYQDQYQLTPEPVQALFEENSDTVIQQQLVSLVLSCWNLRIKDRPLPDVLLKEIRKIRSKAIAESVENSLFIL